jgi:hypothetical protein
MEESMNKKTILAALALASVTVAGPAVAQRSGYQTYQTYPAQTTYDRNDFWRGAPDGLQQRIDWLQQRIDRGVRDGSLDRREYARAQRELNYLRQQAAQLTARLDNLSRTLRWARNNNSGYYGNNDTSRFVTDYDASRYYRDDPRYRERVLGPNDEVYRGSDGRYYCRRSDGTTGLIVGGAGGALLGNVIDGGGNRIAGTLIGGALGALLGRTVDQNTDVRCR